MYDVTGLDLTFVENHPEERIWTLTGKGDIPLIIAGMHPNVSKGYFITHKPHPKNKTVQVEYDVAPQ
jgi:hypothetical protein